MPQDLALQTYLRGFGSVEAAISGLERDFEVKAKQHPEYSSLYLFKYPKSLHDFSSPVVQECRGTILDSGFNWRVVALPYTKFFNHFEPLAADIDWSTAEVLEKVDGSMMTMYHYSGRWHVATSGTPAADIGVNDFGTTFADLFWSTFEAEGYKKSFFKPGFTYIFELCAPQNRVVVRYDEPRLYLTGIRCRTALQEYKPISPFDSKADGFYYRTFCRIPRNYDVGSMDAAVEAARHLEGRNEEGYVIRDAEFRRVKVKSPQYIALHHAKDDMLSLRRMACIIRDGESPEFEAALSAFPEFAKDFYGLKARYDDLVSRSKLVYGSISHIEDKKAFAECVKRTPPDIQSILFAMKVRNISPQTFMSEILEKAYLRLMGVRK